MDDCGDNTDELGCSSSTTTKGGKNVLWDVAHLLVKELRWFLEKKVNHRNYHHETKGNAFMVH